LHEEFEPVAVDSGSKGVQAAKSGQVDLVIMDFGLPDLDGREAVRILRKNGFKAPIIMLTGHHTDSDAILGLESGANDYVAKHAGEFRVIAMAAFPPRPPAALSQGCRADQRIRAVSC
jgi:DNA-binding response OmpR family regulator